MKILLSPAKLMSLQAQRNWIKTTQPKFLDQSEDIAEKLKGMTSWEIAKLMNISSELSEMNYERNQAWTSKPNPKDSIPAILAFKGEVYRGLDAESLSEKGKEFLQHNVFMISGLYGILRPSDRVMLYRLEMGSKLSVDGSKNLYDFWKPLLTEFVNSQTKKGELLLNLASSEYAKVLDKNKLKGNWVDVQFLDYKNGELKKIMMYYKHARGEMAKFCAENEITDLEGIKSFDLGGYQYDDNLSEEHLLTFTR